MATAGTGAQGEPRAAPAGGARLDWASLLVAIVLAALVRAGLVPGVPW